MSKLQMQKKALADAKGASGQTGHKQSNKVEGKNVGKGGGGKRSGYLLADGTQSTTYLAPVPADQTGAWHYYSPRKEVVCHNASYPFCAGLLKAQYSLEGSGPASSKQRFWVMGTAAKPSKLLPKDSMPKEGVWAQGIATIKSWAVKAQQAERAQVAVAQKVSRKATKPKNPVKRLVVDGKPQGPEGTQALKAAEPTQAPYVAVPQANNPVNPVNP